MSLIDSTVIIADDLTGANDTALQFFKNGLNTRIIIDYGQDFSNQNSEVEVFASSTESRNVDKEIAVDRVSRVAKKLKEKLNVETFYKKIDSTLRGNVGVEIIALLEATQKDAAIIAPAYIEENRSTIGGYQLLGTLPIERTQCALDPKAPICDSYIPDILKKDLNPKLYDLIDTIGFKTVTKGAGPISIKLKELIQKGKKLIVVDAMSKTDLEQIVLAMDKSGYDILPCGSAGMASVLLHRKETEFKKQLDRIESSTNLPRLIISGSATNLTFQQIEKLKEEKKSIFYIDLTIEDIINDNSENLISEIVEKLSSGVDVVLHSSYINQELLNDESSNLLIDAGIAKAEFPNRISDFISEIVYEINSKSNFILITVGGETSYKCAYKIGSEYLEILDAIMPAIPLCIDSNNKIVVTKSGNFGTLSTLVDIVNYFNKLRP